MSTPIEGRPLRLAVEVAQLEVVSGYDGPFGGKPEPVLVVGAYVVGRGQAVLLDRAIARFRPHGRYPSSAETLLPATFDADFVSREVDLHFVVLVCALEEDFGEDVRRLYGALEHPADLSVFASAQNDVAPVTLAEVARAGYPSEQVTAVDVLDAGVAVSTRCADDTWVGAALIRLSMRGKPAPSLYRLPFRSADRKNDWTAFATITH